MDFDTSHERIHYMYTMLRNIAIIHLDNKIQTFDFERSIYTHNQIKCTHNLLGRLTAQSKSQSHSLSVNHTV